MIRTRTRTRAGGLSWYKSASYLLNSVAPTYIADFANNRYYNSVSGQIGFPFTSTRTTNATMFDAQGRIVWAPANMILQSQTFNTTWSLTGSLAFGAGSTVDGAIAPDGSTTADIIVEDTTTANHGVSQSGVLAVSQPYTFSVYLKASGRSRVELYMWSGSQYGCGFDLSNGTTFNASSGTTVTGVMTNVGNGWYRCSIKAKPLAGSEIRIRYNNGSAISYTGDGVSGVALWGAQLELTGADSPKEYNVTTTAAYYGPRFDYYPVIVGASTVPGLLSEESRTNIIPKSFNLVPAGDMTTGNASATSTGITYLGGWSAPRITYDGTSASHYGALGPVTPAGSSPVMISAIIKPITGTLFQLTGSGSWVTLNTYANFNLSGAGSVVGSGAGASEIFCHHLGDGVYHIGLSSTTVAAPGAGASSIIAAITAAGDTRLPTNTSTNVFDYIFGGVYQAAGWCMPVPTFGTSATRGGDTFTQAIGAWLDTTKGTLFSKFMRGFVATGSGTGRVFADIGLDTNTRVVLTSGVGTNSQQRFDVLSAAVSQAQIQTSVGGASFTTREMVGLYSTNLFKAAENGASGVDDTSGSVPTGFTNLRVAGYGTTNQIMGWMFEVRYYPDASASSAQLNTLTT